MVYRLNLLSCDIILNCVQSVRQLADGLAKIIYFSCKDGKTESPKVFLIMFLQ
jgi:hypothetical protein